MEYKLTSKDIETIALRVVQEIGVRFATPRMPEAPSPRAPAPSIQVAPPKLTYTLKELAEELGVSKVSVYRLVDRGLIKSLPYLRRKIFTRAEVERFLRDGADHQKLSH